MAKPNYAFQKRQKEITKKKKKEEKLLQKTGKLIYLTRFSLVLLTKDFQVDCNVSGSNTLGTWIHR